MNSTGAGRDKGKRGLRRRIGNRRISHPIAPKGHQKQEERGNAPKGYRIVSVYRNNKERSFDSSGTYTQRQRPSASRPGSFCARKRERFFRSIAPTPLSRFLRSSGRSLLSFRSVCSCYWLLHLESFQMRGASPAP